MNEIEMIDKRIAMLKQQSLVYQQKLMAVNESGESKSQITELEKNITSIQNTICLFMRKKNQLISAMNIR
ncbi:MAG: hypothetical protein KBS86_00415 [Proteobacteria bacterium]|nr:hypothetical protein [Candidatus Enterousia scatequi]